jgi:hypothetical protein
MTIWEAFELGAAVIVLAVAAGLAIVIVGAAVQAAGRRR